MTRQCRTYTIPPEAASPIILIRMCSVTTRIADTPEPGETPSFIIAGEECLLREIVGPALVYSVNYLLKWLHRQELVETRSSIRKHHVTALLRKECERALDIMIVPVAW